MAENLPDKPANPSPADSALQTKAAAVPTPSSDKDLQSSVRKLVADAVEAAESEKWNRIAPWLLFVVGLLLLVGWTIFLILPDAATPAAPVVVASSLLAGAIAASTAAVLLHLGSLRPARTVQASMAALEAQSRVQLLSAQQQETLMSIEARRRAMADQRDAERPPQVEPRQSTT